MKIDSQEEKKSSLHGGGILDETALEPRYVEVDRSRYRCILNEQELIEAVDNIRRAGVLSIDLETTSLAVHQAEILGGRDLLGRE